MDALPNVFQIPGWLAGVLATLLVIKYLLPDLVRTLDRGLARRAAKSLRVRLVDRTDDAKR